jgi:hypothetical protein
MTTKDDDSRECKEETSETVCLTFDDKSFEISDVDTGVSVTAGG